MNNKDTAPIAERAQAVKAALIEQELVSEGVLEQFASAALDWKPENGAKVVARAWLDAEYRERLLADGTKACAELGYEGPQGEYIVALENTPEIHNVIVCTQCSCTAWPVLGLPPDWYKSPEYRARVVREPRRVLNEMGLKVADDVKIRVWETSAETRYIVIPQRPDKTAGWTEAQLAEVVTREAMIGVAVVSV